MFLFFSLVKSKFLFKIHFSCFFLLSWTRHVLFQPERKKVEKHVNGTSFRVICTAKIYFYLHLAICYSVPRLKYQFSQRVSYIPLMKVINQDSTSIFSKIMLVLYIRTGRYVHVHHFDQSLQVAFLFLS